MLVLFTLYTDDNGCSIIIGSAENKLKYAYVSNFAINTVNSCESRIPFYGEMRALGTENVGNLVKYRKTKKTRLPIMVLGLANGALILSKLVKIIVFK